MLLQLSTPCHSHLIDIIVSLECRIGIGKPGPQAVPGAPAATPPCDQTAMQALGLSWRAQGAPPAG